MFISLGWAAARNHVDVCGLTMPLEAAAKVLVGVLVLLQPCVVLMCMACFTTKARQMSMVCSTTCNYVDIMDHVAPEGHISVHGLCCAAVTMFMYIGQATNGNDIGVCDPYRSRGRVDVLGPCCLEELGWHPWPVLWSQWAVLISIICPATGDHSEVCSMC